MNLKPGQDIAPEDLAELLVDAGFNREDPADEHGEFARRGGILDIFPAGASHPVRLEFMGDTIETLRTYDPATQRSIAPIDQLTVVPLRDVLGDDRGATLLDYLAQARDVRVIVSERDEVDANVAEAPRAAAARVRGGGEPPRGCAASRQRSSPTGIRSPRSSPQGTVVSELGLDEEGTHVACQPAVELHGRVGDFVAEIRKLREAGETVMFVAATPGRAERTIELLKEYDVLAVLADRADDARYAAVLVALGNLSRGFRLPAGRPPDLRRSRRFRRRPAHARQAALGHQGVPLRPARSEGRRLRRPRGSRHRHLRRPEEDRRRRQRAGVPRAALRRRGQAVRARRTARPGPEVHRRDASRRSTGWAARRGSASRPGSRRPCATWPKSCSSSTRRARPCRASRSAPIRTGSRSSRTPSSTT